MRAWLVAVTFLVFASAAQALDVVNLSCTNPVRLPDGGLVCVSCSEGTVFDNSSGTCEKVAPVFKPSFLFDLGKTFPIIPSNPSLGGLVVIALSAFAAWRLLKVL